MIERIAELRAEGEAAIAGAAGTAALEQARIAHLGRKAELPNLLRGVAAARRPRSAAPSAAPPTRRAGRSRPRSSRGGPSSSAPSSTQRLAADVVDVTLPGSPAVPVGRLHLLTATRREIEDVFLGLGFRVAEGPEIDTVHYNFDALNHEPMHPPRLRSDTFYTADDVVLRTHTSPMQVRAMELQPPPLYIIVPGRTYRRDSDAHAHAAVPPDRGPRRRRGRHARRPARHAARLRPGDLRRRPRGPPAAALLPVHRAERRGRRLLLQLPRAASCATARAATSARGRAGSRSSAPAWSTRTCSTTCASTATTPSASRASRSAWGSSGSRSSSTACSDLRLFFDNDLRFLEQFG